MIEIARAHPFRPASAGAGASIGSLQDTFKNIVSDVRDVVFKTQDAPAPKPISAPSQSGTILGLPSGMFLLAGGLAIGAGILILVMSKD